MRPTGFLPALLLQKNGMDKLIEETNKAVRQVPCGHGRVHRLYPVKTRDDP